MRLLVSTLLLVVSVSCSKLEYCKLACGCSVPADSELGWKSFPTSNLTVQNDSNGGFSVFSSDTTAFVIQRFLNNGETDPSFSTVSVPGGSLGIQDESGNYIVASTRSSDSMVLLSRFMKSGALDSTFGTAGTITLDVAIKLNRIDSLQGMLWAIGGTISPPCPSNQQCEVPSLPRYYKVSSKGVVLNLSTALTTGTPLATVEAGLLVLAPPQIELLSVGASSSKVIASGLIGLDPLVYLGAMDGKWLFNWSSTAQLLALNSDLSVYPGILNLNLVNLTSAVVDLQGRLLVLLPNGLIRILSGGVADPNFATTDIMASASASPGHLAVLSDGTILSAQPVMSGCLMSNITMLKRYPPDGGPTLDP